MIAEILAPIRVQDKVERKEGKLMWMVTMKWTNFLDRYVILVYVRTLSEICGFIVGKVDECEFHKISKADYRGE